MVKEKNKPEGVISKGKRFYNHFMSDSLYRNSIYLMLNTGIMAALGFVFWVIVARLYPVEQVGLATTIISVMGLITSFSLLGLNTGLIRFLPKSKQKNNKINTTLTLSTLVTIIVTTIFLLGVNDFSPRLYFIKHNALLSYLFIFFMIISVWNTIIDSIFIAFRSSIFVLIKNIIFSIGKIILPLPLIFLGAYWIFASWIISMFIGVILSLLILSLKFSIKLNFVLIDNALRKIINYSFINYTIGFFWGLPLLIFPIMITSYINPISTAHFYITLSIASITFSLSQSVSNSLFAEGSYNSKNLKLNIIKSLKIVTLISLFSILATLILGRFILGIFGEDYSSEGYTTLIIFSVSSLFVSFNFINISIYRILNKLKYLTFTIIIGSLTTVIISFSLIYFYKDITYLAISYIIGQFVILIMLSFRLLFKLRGYK